jgi:hypothetical protein
MYIYTRSRLPYINRAMLCVCTESINIRKKRERVKKKVARGRRLVFLFVLILFYTTQKV